MRILVTGASGFVGGVIASYLTKRGHTVVGLGRSKNSNDHFSEYIQTDITNPLFVESMLSTQSPCSVVVHAAAAIHKNDNMEISATNCLGTQQVLKLSRIWQVKKIIYLSSVPVIGEPRELPIEETHSVNPKSIYHASKLYGEYLTKIAMQGGIESIILRLTSPVGYGMPLNRIFSVFVNRATENKTIFLDGKGERRQNYVDVRDISKAVESCLQVGIQGLFNIGGGKSISNIELAKSCIAILKSSSSIMYSGNEDCEEHLNWDVSIEKAALYLGYRPQYNIEESICAVGGKVEDRDN